MMMMMMMITRVRVACHLAPGNNEWFRKAWDNKYMIRNNVRSRHRERWEENIMELGAEDEKSLQGQETGFNIRR